MPTTSLIEVDLKATWMVTVGRKFQIHQQLVPSQRMWTDNKATTNQLPSIKAAQQLALQVIAWAGLCLWMPKPCTRWALMSIITLTFAIHGRGVHQQKHVGCETGLHAADFCHSLTCYYTLNTWHYESPSSFSAVKTVSHTTVLRCVKDLLRFIITDWMCKVWLRRCQMGANCDKMMLHYSWQTSKT